MKNQYFGDINDYKKYSLLRILAEGGRIETAVCWALTEDDSRNDGKRITYLENPEIWGKYDPSLYKYLRKCVIENGNRHVSNIERSNILNNCRFFSDVIQDDAESRDQYFRKFFNFASGVDLIFFDPDNGLEVKSVPRGKRNSSKYIYWDEVKTSYESGHSILIYQHFPRKPRDTFIRNLVQQFKTFEGIRSIISYCTNHVAFLLVPQPQHEQMFNENTTQVTQNWGDLIRIKRHKIIKTQIVY